MSSPAPPSRRRAFLGLAAKRNLDLRRAMLLEAVDVGCSLNLARCRTVVEPLAPTQVFRWTYTIEDKSHG